MSTSMDIVESWSSVLSRARQCRQEGGDVFEGFQAFLGLWVHQIFLYMDFFSRPREEGLRLSEDEKLLIVETRAAIRFGLCCCSSSDDDHDSEDKQRNREIQIVVTRHRWHQALATLLSTERCDSRCRSVAAKLFCNIMTANHVSAMAVAETIRLSPSQSEVWNKIHTNTLSSSELPGEPSTSPPLSSSWAEMIVVSARERSREPLAGVVAALYNCTLALLHDNQLLFARRIVSDAILISSLLRQLISVNALQRSLGSSNSQDEKGETWDDATEWILLLLSYFFQWGLLPMMYHTVGPEDGTTIMVLPEQNALLHCAAHEAQAFVDNNMPYKEKINPFGGKIGIEAVKESYVFLVDLVCRLHSVGSNTVDSADESTIDVQLSKSAALTSLDIISMSLGVDYDQSHQLREYLGESTELIPTCALVLGRLVDELTLRSVGVKARDLKLSTEEQQWMVSLVRLLGNICFDCRTNQDRIRTTLVPPSSPTNATTATTPATGAGEIDVSNTTVQQQQQQQPQEQYEERRNCLHVLLSCTSFATSCFTLREWGVIAIRHILRDNEGNQAVVAALQAQTPVQSMALEEAGIRVQLGPNGTVGLSPVNETNGDCS